MSESAKREADIRKALAIAVLTPWFSILSPLALWLFPEYWAKLLGHVRIIIALIRFW